jgi:cell division protease FtsH
MFFTDNYSHNLLAAEEVNQQPLSVYSKMTYGRFLEYIDKGWIKKVDFYNDSKFAIVEASSPELGNRPQKIGVNIPTKDVKLILKLKQTKIDFDVHPVEPTTKALELFSSNLRNFGVLFILLVGFYFLFGRNRNFRGGGMGPLGFRLFNKAKARFDSEPNTGIRFDDVAGIDEIKEEFQEIVTFLQKPQRYTAVGARIPKGVLLAGPPGTGKTLLAKAIAGEAGVPFFSCSASEFVELFVGIGASRIRDLFRRAKTKSPCIIFIDEIDAVGRQRGSGIGGGNDEREQTLNQLLTEMDGFETNNGVIVIAATNRVDILDSALLRPGRFDRQLTVDLPDCKARLEILNVHAKNKKIAENITLETIAKRTAGFSGADLSNILNEAAILTARNNEKAITMTRLNEAVEKIVGGIPGVELTDSKTKRLLAYHEIGHALAASLLVYHDPVERVSIIPRGRTKGATNYISNQDQGLISRNQLFARIIAVLAGRAAEDIIFGKTEVTTAAANDIQMATNIARQMVTKFGMSQAGPIAFETPRPRDIMMRGSRTQYSDTLSYFIDNQVRAIVYNCYIQSLQIIKNNRDLLDELVNLIIEKETIEGQEIRSLIYKNRAIRLILKDSKLKETPKTKVIKDEFDKILQTLINNTEYREKLSSLKSESQQEEFLDKVIEDAYKIYQEKSTSDKLQLK